jgi:hypothetical protein
MFQTSPLLLACVLLTGSAVSGQEGVPVEPRAIDPALKQLEFRDLDGKVHRPLDATGVKAVVLIFINTDCPIANGYVPEINAIVKAHAGNPIRVFLVHADPALTLETARKHAKEFNLSAPVLIDRKHTLVKAAGVAVTPEAAIITADGMIAYRGRIDNAYEELGKRRRVVTHRDLRDAIPAALSGKGLPITRSKAIGCAIPVQP